MTRSAAQANTETSSRGSRLGHQHYFDVALDVLGKHGHEALTIAALCEALDVSKGSFYHHFGGWPGFMDALLTYWERASTLQITEMAARIEDPVTRLGLLRKMAMAVDHDAEAAIRVWSRSEPVAQQVQDRVDKNRIAAVTDLVALQLPLQDARRIAELAHALLVGTQMTSRPVSVQRFLREVKALDTLIEAKYGVHVLG